MVKTESGVWFDDMDQAKASVAKTMARVNSTVEFQDAGEGKVLAVTDRVVFLLVPITEVADVS